MKEKIYRTLPHLFQNLAVTTFNLLANNKRFGGRYEEYIKLFKKNRSLSRSALLEIQNKRFATFVKGAICYSSFYKELYKNIGAPCNLGKITQLPIIDKEILRSNIDSVVMDTEEELEVFKTGGTTGKSLEVYYRAENLQERFAMLDDFRSRFGYKLGKKTAWFSGKSLLSAKDVRKHRFWKTDYYHKVRYYSTFHINEEYLKYYIENLMKFKPEYFVGFPSTIRDIAIYGLENGYDFPKDTIKAIFPTAETITKEMRVAIETFFKTKLYDQYASSEGAPFIFECVKGNLHIELQSGVFEVLDENDQPAQSGRLVVTAFATEGTPLIRYDIGDSITLDNPSKICGCGNNNPMVLEILGRADDYIYSSESGKINLGNVSNTLKETRGIKSFQVIQNSLDCLEIYVITDDSAYTDKIESLFLKNWSDRVGPKMKLNLHYVNDIPVEKSGKFRMVKNNIKDLIEAEKEER